MVPEGWIHTTFGKHIECLTGFAFKSDRYSNAEDDIPLLRGDNIEPGNLRWRNAKLWPKNEIDGLDDYHLKDGDFVIALDRTWISSGLKVAEVTTEDLPCLLVQRVARIRAKDSLEQSLLRQYFSGHRFKQYVKSVQTATAVPHISPNDIKEFTVQLPPPSEQKKIAQILSTWDQAITATERLLENSQRRKKGLMQQLLTGTKRLPGVQGEWSFVSFSEGFSVANQKTSQVKSSEYQLSGEIPIVDQGQTEIAGYCEHRSPYTDVPVIVFGDHTRVVKWVDFAFCPGADGTQVLKAKNSLDDKFAFFVLTHIELPNLGYSRHMRELKQRTFKIPVEVKEQRRIATVLTAADAEIQALCTRLNCLKQEKKALMQQLLTGKRRVKVDAEAA